jgi:hypothetical protein
MRVRGDLYRLPRRLTLPLNIAHRMTLRTRPVMGLDVPDILDESLDYLGGLGRRGERVRVVGLFRSGV